MGKLGYFLTKKVELYTFLCLNFGVILSSFSKTKIFKTKEIGVGWVILSTSVPSSGLSAGQGRALRGRHSCSGFRVGGRELAQAGRPLAGWCLSSPWLSPPQRTRDRGLTNAEKQEPALWL